MNMIKYLEDLKNYCEKNNINFAKCSKNQQLAHIRTMLKLIVKQSHIKL